MVARTRYCQHPEEAVQLPQIGGITDPSPEAILAQKPDLVIIGRLTPLSVYRQLQRLNLPILPINTTGVDGIHESIRLIAEALEIPGTGKELSDKIEKSLDIYRKATAEVPVQKRPRTLLLTGTTSYFAAGKGSFAGQILELVGARNIAPDTHQPWPQLSVEKIISENPQVIIISLAHEDNELSIAKDRLESWKSDPLWKKIDAIRNNRVYFVRDNLLTIPGPRIPQAASILSQYINGRP